MFKKLIKRIDPIDQAAITLILIKNKMTSLNKNDADYISADKKCANDHRCFASSNPIKPNLDQENITPQGDDHYPARSSRYIVTQHG